MSIPLTASDLRDIAVTVDQTDRRFGEMETLTKYGEKFYQIRLELLRPGGDDIIGYITYEDGWLGFVPYGASE